MHSPTAFWGVAGRAQGSLGAFPAGDYTLTTSLRVYDAVMRTLTVLCPTSPHTRTFTVYSAPPAIAPVVEFYHQGLDRYFITQDPMEIRPSILAFIRVGDAPARRSTPTSLVQRMARFDRSIDSTACHRRSWTRTSTRWALPLRHSTSWLQRLRRRGSSRATMPSSFRTRTAPKAPVLQELSRFIEVERARRQQSSLHYDTQHQGRNVGTRLHRRRIRRRRTVPLPVGESTMTLY